MPGPIAAPGSICPLRGKDVSKVCHVCAWHVLLEGIHPQTGERLNRWMCAVTAQVLTSIDAGRAAAETGATVQAMRNDQHHERRAQTRLLLSRPSIPAESISTPLLTNGAADD